MSLKENQVGSRALLGLSKGVKCLEGGSESLVTV